MFPDWALPIIAFAVVGLYMFVSHWDWKWMMWKASGERALEHRNEDDPGAF
jgi:hypothetical protein